MFFRKGSARHVRAGRVFVASMLIMAVGAVYLGIVNRPLRLLSVVGIGQHLTSALFSTGLYFFLSILPLVLLIFWLVRVRFTKAFKGKPMPLSGDVYSLPA
jgi:hypothetical protein